MVECLASIDLIFGSLADPTRRDILRRVSQQELSVTELSKPYALTMAAVSKHLGVLERAKLITKRRQGKHHMVSMAPKAIDTAATCLREYQALWEDRLGSLERYLKTMK
jgi:DNA-binding transcriptional ArsR family regulator